MLHVKDAKLGYIDSHTTKISKYVKVVTYANCNDSIRQGSTQNMNV